jgi:hypothetical protein
MSVLDLGGRLEAARILQSNAGSVGAAWPLASRSQQPATPVAGFLSSLSPLDLTFVMPAFHQGLNEAGFVEGRNIAIEYRWAEGHYERLPALAADLVCRQVAAIAAISGTRRPDQLRRQPARRLSTSWQLPWPRREGRKAG